MKAQLIVDSKSILGEGPIWHPARKELFWVDIEGKKINQFCADTHRTETRAFNKMPGAIAPVDHNTLLVAFEDGIAIYDLQTGTVSYRNLLGKDTTMIRGNDGKCDPNGNFWIGTMHLKLEQGAGALYRLDRSYELTKQVSNRTISNGLAWSENGETMFYIDSWDNEVVAYDFDLETSQIANKRTVFSINPEMGSPDGMTIDQNDKLWIAHWGGGCVRQWDPQSGEVLNTIDVPAPHVTSCIFGGVDLDELYITSARYGLSEKQLLEFPLSGGVFKVTPDSKGIPMDFFQPINNE